jgi:hypothetical protein
MRIYANKIKAEPENIILPFGAETYILSNKFTMILTP